MYVFVLPQYKFWPIIASLLNSIYCDSCNRRTDTNCTASWTFTCLSFVALLSVNYNKTTLHLSDQCPMCLFFTSPVATQFTPHATFQVTFLQTKRKTVVTVGSFTHRLLSVLYVSEFFECNKKFFGTDIANTSKIFQISNASCWAVPALGKATTLSLARTNWLFPHLYPSLRLSSLAIGRSLGENVASFFPKFSLCNIFFT